MPLYVRLHWAVARPEVRNLRLHPSGNPRLDRVWVEAPRGRACSPAADAQASARGAAGLGTGRMVEHEGLRRTSQRAMSDALERAERPFSADRCHRSPTPPPRWSNWVFPEHAGAPGQIHGGRMMQWIATCGTIAASRVARGNVRARRHGRHRLPAPVKVGEVAVLRAQVECVGRCSLEVGVQVFAESPQTGERALTLSSHLVFVKVDEHRQPVPVPRRSSPRGADEEASVAAAQERRRHRLERFARRAERRRETGDDGDEELRWRVRVVPLGPARGHDLREDHVRRQAPDGHRRGRRHPLDALQPRPRHDGVPRRARLLRAHLDQRGR